MKNGYFITMGTLGVSFIYYPKIDKLYGILTTDNQKSYKSMPYLYVVLISGILTSVILLMFNQTPFIRMVFSLNTLQCMLISIITVILCRKTMIVRTIKKLSNTCLVEIPFEDATTGHYSALKNHTFMAGGLVVVLYAFAIINWINRFEFFNFAYEDDIVLLFLIFSLFIVAGIICALLDPIGRFKLIRRIRKEKRRLKKEK